MSYILYEGESLVDKKPIVVIMTGVDSPSQNSKTGAMAQTYILRSDISPVEAVKTKEDISVCGECPHRGTTCYVNVTQGPTSVWNAYKRGKYKPINLIKAGYNRSIRLGAYGDPNVPIEVWDKLLSKARMWTGYTHQPLQAPGLMKYVQASADTPEEALHYQSLGWKTFRVKVAGEPLLKGEVLCPNTATGMQCSQCGLCNGVQKNVAIDVHGLKHKIDKYALWRDQLEIN